jgi:hypothetical protein
MNDIENALLVLSFVIIIIVIILYLYEKQNKLNNKSIDSSIDSSIEKFANYQDVKTKTENWCNKMLQAGLLNKIQFDTCLSSFQDANSGIMPKEFKTPNTGMSRNYSLYNTTSKNLSSHVSGENTNTIMLVNSDGLYMGCDKTSNVYFIKDINATSVNQKEIYFTLIPQSNNVYLIMSSYGKYLIINSGPSVGDSTIPTGMSSRQEWCASFTGNSIGPMTNWTITVLQNNINNNGNKATFQSVQLSNFFLSSSQNSQDSSLVVNYGSDEVNTWIMIPKLETNNDANINGSNESVNNYSTEYIVAKDILLKKISQIKAQIICFKSCKGALNNLQYIIRNKYDNIKNHINSLLDEQLEKK